MGASWVLPSVTSLPGHSVRGCMSDVSPIYFKVIETGIILLKDQVTVVNCIPVSIALIYFK
jgi:hypothetical protein